ncbi:MAG: 16S rRNA (cytidine(1402)-2'-O)-methyltransferase [Reyranellaceae bacterium]
MATPIGHARDITLRALDVLAGADLIACEDTRVTAKLLAIYGIRTTLMAYHDHNAERARPQILQALRADQVVALVSDAGTPLIADPGYRLVREAAASGLPVTALPGASALLAGLSLSGLPTDRFLFAGFLPERGAERRRALAELAGVPATLVFFESPRRIGAALADALQMLGDREAAVGRELTKKFEEVRRGSLADLARHYAGEAEPPKGEIVLTIGPPSADAAASVDAAAIDQALRAALEKSSLKQAVADVAAATGAARKLVYARALRLKEDG